MARLYVTRRGATVGQMAIPDYQSLMLPVLEAAAEGETRVPHAAKIIAERFGLSEADREEMLPSGKQRLLHNRIHWAKFYLTKAGLIDNPRQLIPASIAARSRTRKSNDKGCPIHAGLLHQRGF